MFKRIRDIAAASIFGFVTMCSPALFQAAHADLKGIELTSDTPLPMYHVSSSTLNLQSNTTLQGIPDLTQDLVAGNVYTCHAHLIGSSDTSTTIGGIRVSLAATNGLTASPVQSSTIVYNGTAAVANNVAAALGNMVSFTGRYTDVILDASFSATHSGTIQLQAAQVASDATITSVGQGSTFNCIHTPGTIAQAIQQGTPPMAAPFSGGASPNGNNYATGCNNGSCLVAEDVFQATTLNTAWNPYYASAALTGTYARNTDSYTVGGLAGLSLTGLQDSASYTTHCTGTSLATNPPYAACGTAAASSSNFYGLVTFADTYFHPDTTHLFGDGFQFNIVATPSMALGTTTCGSDAACSKGAVWKSSAISSATGCVAYSSSCFVLPSSGGYIQIRTKMPDSSNGAMPTLSLLTDGGGTTDSGEEISITQGGYNYTPSGGSAVPTNRVFAAAYNTAGHLFQTNTGPSPYTVSVIGGTTYLIFGSGVPGTLQVGMNVFDVTNPAAIPTGNNFACISNITAPNVQLDDCSGGSVATNTINSSTPDDIWFGIGQVQNVGCNTNTTDGNILSTGFPTGSGSGTSDGTGSFSCARDVGVGQDMNTGYHVYGIEYIPNSSITVYFDNVQVAQWSGDGIGSSAYDLVMYLDVANSTASNGNFHTAEAWPTTSPPTAAPATSYTMQVNDVQLYKPPTGATATGNQAFVMNAPTSGFQNGNYATGCAGSPGAASAAVDAAPGELRSATGQHTCLMFDDHWNGTGTSSPTTNLNLNNWTAGLVMCNNGGPENCNIFAGTPGFAVNYPLSQWCPFGPACFNSIIYDPTYANVSSVTGINLGSFVPLQRAGDGSLALGLKYFFPVSADQFGNPTNNTSSFCLQTSQFGGNCTYANWINGGMTAGGLTGGPTAPNTTIGNTNAIIPVTGGMMQWRMKMDNGVLNGGFGEFQCSAVGGSFPATGANDASSNIEFGYLSHANGGGVPDARSIGNGMNDQAIQNGNGAGNTYVSTGDDGVGSGDTRNWHTYAVEWTSTHQWWYYVDGVSQTISGLDSNHGGPASPHVETRVPTVGWNCSFSHMLTGDSFNSFHSAWLRNADGSAQNPGPYFAYISDVQFFKKPGT